MPKNQRIAFNGSPSELMIVERKMRNAVLGYFIEKGQTVKSLKGIRIDTYKKEKAISLRYIPAQHVNEVLNALLHPSNYSNEELDEILKNVYQLCVFEYDKEARAYVTETRKKVFFDEIHDLSIMEYVMNLNSPDFHDKYEDHLANIETECLMSMRMWYPNVTMMVVDAINLLEEAMKESYLLSK